MKKLTIIIKKCPDCPYSVQYVGNKSFCVKNGKGIEIESVPSYCPLEDSNAVD